MISRQGAIRTPLMGFGGRAPRQPAKTATAAVAAKRARVAGKVICDPVPQPERKGKSAAQGQG